MTTKKIAVGDAVTFDTCHGWKRGVVVAVGARITIKEYPTQPTPWRVRRSDVRPANQ